MKRRQHQQMVESDHAPYPYQRSQPQHEVSSVRLSLIIGIVILGMLLIAVVILGILSLFDVIHGHPGATWNAWVGAWNAVKWWLLAGVIAVVALNTLKEHSRTAVERAEAKRIREEARQTREETRRMRDLRWHNEDYMPPVYIAHPDEIGNYGQMIDADGRLTGYLFPGNAQTGNAGINPKHLMDFMERQQRVVDADEYEEEDAPLQIEAPKKILLSEQIERGLTMPDEEESVFGYPIDTYEPMRVVLFEREGNFVNSLFVVGQQNQGKSTIGTYFAALTVNHGGYLLVIDPDAEISEQSLSSRLGPLKNFLLCEVADTPEKAKRLLELAEDEIDHPSDFPLLLLVDEFSLIMRHGKAGGKWQKVAALCASTVENYATRGRKRLRRAVVFGQISNASRTGGTELRDSCAQIIFQTPYRKAVLVLQDADDVDTERIEAGIQDELQAEQNPDLVAFQEGRAALPDRVLDVPENGVREATEPSERVQNEFTSQPGDKLLNDLQTQLLIAYYQDCKDVKLSLRRIKNDKGEGLGIGTYYRHACWILDSRGIRKRRA